MKLSARTLVSEEKSPEIFLIALSSKYPNVRRDVQINNAAQCHMTNNRFSCSQAGNPISPVDCGVRILEKDQLRVGHVNPG